MQQKRLLLLACWMIAGGALGILASTVLFSLWFRLGWRQPVAAWLSARGMSRMAGYWGLAWLHLLDWLIVGLASIAATVFVRRQLLPKITLFCVSFVLAPDLLAIVSGYNPLAMGACALAMALLLDISVISLGIAVAVSLGAVRTRLSNTHRRGFGVSPAGYPADAADRAGG